MLDEAKELLEQYVNETYPVMPLYKSTRDWLARYEQRREMVVKIIGDAPCCLWMCFDMGIMQCSPVETEELALADARRVADELGLRLKVEGE